MNVGFGESECGMWGKTEGMADSLPLFGDVKHHDHAITVLINIQELCVESHFGFRLHREQNISKITMLFPAD